MVVILLAFDLERNQVTFWEEWFMSLLVTVSCGSALLLFSPIGFLRNGEGFQGLLNHPQTLGVFLAPMVSWLAARILGGGARRLLEIPLVIGGGCFLFLTESRGAVLALVLGLAVALVPRLKPKKTMKRVAFSRVAVVVSVAMLSSVLVIMEWKNISDETSKFMRKRSSAGTVLELAEASRGDLTRQSWSNFLENPLLGIGFGIPSAPSSLRIDESGVLGIPTGAAIEKGVLPIAVLEETGLFGAAFLVAFAACLVMPVLRSNHAPAVAICITAFAVNLGEAVLFSFGGNGLYIWLMIGFSCLMAVTAAGSRRRSQAGNCLPIRSRRELEQRFESPGVSRRASHIQPNRCDLAVWDRWPGLWGS